MNEVERLAAARAGLRSQIEALVGPGPIDRFDEALTHSSFANEMDVPEQPAPRVPGRRGSRRSA